MEEQANQMVRMNKINSQAKIPRVVWHYTEKEEQKGGVSLNLFFYFLLIEALPIVITCLQVHVYYSRVNQIMFQAPVPIVFPTPRHTSLTSLDASRCLPRYLGNRFCRTPVRRPCSLNPSTAEYPPAATEPAQKSNTA